MDRDTIIRLAIEAKLVCDWDGGCASAWVEGHDLTPYLERFAALVANEERQAVLDTIDALMGGERETNNMFSEGYDYALGQIEEFVRARGEAK